MRAIFAICFVLAVNTTQERLEHLCKGLVQQTVLLATEGSAIKHSAVYTSTPPYSPFNFSRVWIQEKEKEGGGGGEMGSKSQVLNVSQC